MRSGRSFLILLVLAAGIGAYAYFVESKRDISETPATKSEKVWTIDTAKIEQLDLKASNGDVTTLKKTGDKWTIVAPVAADADQEAVSTVVTSLSSLETTKTVDENPASVKAFELDPPSVSVTVRLTGDKDAKQLDLGSKTPMGSEMYARVKGQTKVILVGGFLESQLNRTTFDLRDKTALAFNRGNVDSLTLQTAGAPAVSITKKSSEEWRLGAPSNAKADFSVVDGVIGQLAQAKMKAIIETDGKDLKKYGLDKPQAVATIGAGSSRATLALGAKTPDGSLYAKDMTRPLIFTVEATLLDEVKKKADDLRQKMLFEFRSYTAVSMDITHGAESFSFVKQAAQPQPGQAGAGADTWKQTKPAAKDLDTSKMTDFLVDVANLKAASFADRAAGSGDEYVITVRFGDEKAPKEERVTFRKSGTTVHAVQQGEPGAAVVPTADFDKVVTGLKTVTGGK